MKMESNEDYLSCKLFLQINEVVENYYISLSNQLIGQKLICYGSSMIFHACLTAQEASLYILNGIKEGKELATEIREREKKNKEKQ